MTSSYPLTDEIFALLAAPLEAHFGPGIEALVIFRRGAAPGGASCLDLSKLPNPRRRYVERAVVAAVDRFGVPAHLSGRHMLIEGVVQLAEVWPRRLPLTTHLYPGVAEVLSSTGVRVERAIRHAGKVVLRRYPERYQACIGRLEHVTNGELLARLLELVRADLAQGGVAG